MCQELLCVSRQAAPERYPAPSVPCAAPPSSPLAVVPRRCHHSQEGKTYASQSRFFCGMFFQEVVAPTRHGPAFRSLRQKVTGDTPSLWVGCSRLGPPAATTPVAGATNVAPPLERRSSIIPSPSPAWVPSPPGGGGREGGKARGMRSLAGCQPVRAVPPTQPPPAGGRSRRPSPEIS